LEISVRIVGEAIREVEVGKVDVGKYLTPNCWKENKGGILRCFGRKYRMACRTEEGRAAMKLFSQKKEGP